MTFTHEMARILLLEQIYRAGSILHNRSYHKE
jgi:23S rRNA (pseudouridine1915-N3)-methyltransferase